MNMKLINISVTKLLSAAPSKLVTTAGSSAFLKQTPRDLRPLPRLKQEIFTC